MRGAFILAFFIFLFIFALYIFVPLSTLFYFLQLKKCVCVCVNLKVCIYYKRAITSGLPNPCDSLVDNQHMLHYIRDKTAVPYFSNLVWFIGSHVIELDKCVQTDEE